MNKFKNYYTDVLLAAEKNSTCKRLQVAAIIVKNGRILSTGWNGSLPKKQHCCDYFKDIDINHPDFLEQHRIFSAQNESHAEISAIAFAAKEGIKIDGCEMVVSLTPCVPCATAIVMAGITKVYYLRQYDRSLDGLYLLENSIEVVEL